MLGKNQILIGDKPVVFSDISKYKIHRMRGAGLKLRMKNGKIFRLSSNDNFCDSYEFIRFVNAFENKVINYPEIRKVKTFGETKFGLYFAISLTFLVGIAIIFKKINGEDIEFVRLAIVLVVLTSMWSGIEIKKIFTSKK